MKFSLELEVSEEQINYLIALGKGEYQLFPSLDFPGIKDLLSKGLIEQCFLTSQDHWVLTPRAKELISNLPTKLSRDFCIAEGVSNCTIPVGDKLIPLENILDKYPSYILEKKASYVLDKHTTAILDNLNNQ